jgi:hypothetical protein
MSGRERIIVRVTRPDGSVTFRCDRPTRVRAERERDAWNDTDSYRAEIVSLDDSRAELRAHAAAVKRGDRYFPGAIS